jgi:hypothetical protein
MTIALEALLVAHMFYYTVLFYIMSRSALYIPIAQARGFTAHFGKLPSIKNRWALRTQLHTLCVSVPSEMISYQPHTNAPSEVVYHFCMTSSLRCRYYAINEGEGFFPIKEQILIKD